MPISRASSGGMGNASSTNPSISDDGRYAAFNSHATNLLPLEQDTNGKVDVFVRDLVENDTVRISKSPEGIQGNGDSGSGSNGVTISADGRFVVFSSAASNLLGPNEDTNNARDVFVYEIATKQITRVSVSSTGEQAKGVAGALMPDISADGRYVSFSSSSSNLVLNDPTGWDVFVHDRKAQTTIRASVDLNGLQPNGNSGGGSGGSSISDDGRFVVFASEATDLVSSDTNQEVRDVFVRDMSLTTNAIELVSVTSDALQVGVPSGSAGPSISGGGRFVAFDSTGQLVNGDSNGLTDIFVRDRKTAQTSRVSVTATGSQSTGATYGPIISGRGRHVAFTASSHTALVSDDTNNKFDVYVRDRVNGETPDSSIFEVYPLLGAHGITGDPEDMYAALEVASSLIPGLPETVSANTGEISSIWFNGAVIAQEAVTLIEATGASRVNLIAHSKGGLDSRVAMWKWPELFHGLGMIATPNRGSLLADRLCTMKRTPIGGGYVAPDFGDCTDPEDALYNLQTWYVDWLNESVVRDWDSHRHFAVAGHCETTLKCWGSNFANGVGADPHLGCAEGGDGAVCVESVFALDSDRSDGLHHALNPIFNDFDHTEMRTSPCPASRIYAELYGPQNVGNPWLDSPGGGECHQLPPDFSSIPPNYTEFQAAEWYSATAGEPLLIPLDPEGGDSLFVSMYMPRGITSEAIVLDPEGVTDPYAKFGELESIADEAASFAYLSGLGGEHRTLSITTDQDTVVGVLTRVESSGVTVQSEVSAPATGGESLLTATLTGDEVLTDASVGVVARFEGPSGLTEIELEDQGVIQGSRTFEGTATVETGAVSPVDFVVSGPVDRIVSTAIAFPDGSASLGSFQSQELVDETGDGKPDTLRLIVDVEVDIEGEYHLAVDLFDSVGSFVTSAPGSGVLAVGQQEMRVDVPIASLLGAGLDGPYELRNAALTRGGTSLDFVATKETLGFTDAFDVGSVTPSQLVITTPSGAEEDRDASGSPDAMVFSTEVTAPIAGEYAVEAVLLGPDGRLLVEHFSVEILGAGSNPLTMGFDGAVVAENGNGDYTLQNLRLTSLDDRSVSVEAEPALFTVDDASGWSGLGDSPG